MSKKQAQVPYAETKLKRNDRTLRVPPIIERGRFSNIYREYTEDINVCYGLVNIGSYIVDKRLRLIVGDSRNGITKAATDGRNIFLPKLHPNRRVATKHELAHIFFKSNLTLRLAFVRGLIKKLEDNQGRPIASHLKKQMTDDLCFFINILDDWRVNSLWGLIYPGDGRDIEDYYVNEIGPFMKKKALDVYANGDIDHLFTYAILLCLDQDVKSSKWGEFEDDIIQARDNVLWTSFPACLVSCRHLVEKILKKLSEQMLEDQEDTPDPLKDLSIDVKDVGNDLGDLDDSDQDLSQTGPTQGMEEEILKKRREVALSKVSDKALRELFQGKKPSARIFRSDNAGFDYDHQIEERGVYDKLVLSEVKRILDLDCEDEEAVYGFLDRAGELGNRNVQRIRKKLDTRVHNKIVQHDDYLKKSVKAELRIVKVDRHRLRSATVSQADRDAAEKWRRQMIRLMGALKNRMVHQGGRLSVPDLIRAQQSGIPVPCFRQEVTGRGFEVIISVDMSSSMSGDIFSEVERLAFILRHALDFPFVKIRVQGWTSLEGGVITLYEYPPLRKDEGLVSPESQVGGVTPLSFAVQIAGQSLRNSRNERHIFLISDGYPVYRLKGKKRYLSSDILREWTRDAVLELRKQRIQCWCWMLGDNIPLDGMMDQMFGAKHWRKIDVDRLCQDGFDFLTQQFLSYVRSR